MNNQQLHEYINWYIANTPFSLLAVGRDKRPLTRHGCKDATRCNTTLHCWANTHSNMNLAIACGPQSNCVVVDIDTKPARGVSGEESLTHHYGESYQFDYDNYLWTMTPSGGKHLYFQWNDEYPVTSFNGVLENVDIKGNGGYVLAEPALVVYDDKSSGVYAFHDITKPLSPLTPWAKDLLSLCLQPQNSEKKNHSINYHEAIHGIPQGRRENSIFTFAWGMRKQGIDIDTAKAFIRQVAANCNPPFPIKEAEQKVIRAYNYELPKSLGEKS